MEKDGQINGEGNSYTTEYRQFDPRIARWTSLDPLMGQYPNQSPYMSFNGNPIRFADPNGLEGEVDAEGNANANIYFVNDGLSAEDFAQAVENAMANINAGLQANNIGTGGMNYYSLSPNADVNSLLSENKLNNVVTLTAGGGTSFVDGAAGGQRNVMQLFQSDANGTGGTPNVPFHETLHLFGLSDRYHETRNMPNGVIDEARGRTVPMRNLWTTNDMQENDQGYDWRTNAMSNAGLNLTQNQISIMSDRNNYEQTYKTALLLNPNAQITNADFYITKGGGVMFQAYSGTSLGFGNTSDQVSSQGYYNRNTRSGSRNAMFGAVIWGDGSGSHNRRIINSLVR